MLNFGVLLHIDSVNAILEPIGITFLEDIYSALEKARKRFTAWMFNIEG